MTGRATSWTRARLALLTIASLTAFAALTGCGDDSDSAAQDGNGNGSAASGIDIEGATAEVEKYKAVPAFEPMADAFDASSAKGKVIFNIPISSALPFIKGIDEGQQQAADAAGVKIINYPNQGKVEEWVRGFDQAISRKADLIILDAAPNPAQLQPQIKKAQAAGIPVMATHMPLNSEFPEGTLPPENLANLTAVVPGPFPKAAELQVDYAIANTDGGKVNALIITSNEVAASKGIVKMTQDQFKERCGSECKTTVVNVPLTDWATKIQSEVQSALLRDPSINWVMPIFDSMSQFAEPAVRAAQKKDVKIATFNGTVFVLKMIKDGDIVAMDVGESLNWLGWAFMDQALRILADGVEPVEYDTAPTPLRIWDDSNVAEAGDPPKDSVGYGDEYKQGYLDLWGLGG